MDKENKLVEERKDKKTSSGDSNGRCKRRKEPFPPKLSSGKKCILGFCYIAIIFALFYLIEQFCSIHAVSWLTERSAFLTKVCRPCAWGTYIAFGVVVAVLVIHHWVWQKIVVHKERLEDRSEIESIIVEACTVEPRLTHPEKRPKEYERKAKELMTEVDRVRELGERGWTEYQVLSLNQLLVDFLKEDELKGRAKSSLEDLQEYTAYSTSRHDPEHFNQWKDRIDKAIENIKEDEVDELKRDEAAEKLRGELRTLLEHVADYDQYWDQGLAIIRSLMTCGVAAIPLLLAMGLLQILHPAGNNVIGIVNWGFLGISGAIAAVLLKLHKSDLLYVGSTKGREATWRAVLGAALGLVAGILMYSMIASGILAGDAFPSPEAFPEIDSEVVASQVMLKDVARCIFWGIFSGFSFEWVFDRMRSETKEVS